MANTWSWVIDEQCENNTILPPLIPNYLYAYREACQYVTITICQSYHYVIAN